MSTLTTAGMPERQPSQTVGPARTAGLTLEEMQARSDAAAEQMAQDTARRTRSTGTYRCSDCESYVPNGPYIHCCNGRTWMRDGEMVSGCHRTFGNPERNSSGGAAYVKHLELAGHGYCNSIDLSGFVELEGVFYVREARTRKP